MAEGYSLINLGELSKPATVLVEKVCNAVGIIYEPTRIRRQANADADAEKIKALAGIELRDIEQRAIERFVRQETRKQNNIESITAQAASALPPNANVEALDEDWVAHFFKQCDTVSDKEMQSLWARLLSGEATKPGTFSRRTVEFISTIDKKDATLFTAFCQFVWVIGTVTPLIYDVDSEIYMKQGINFVALKHLDAIGLISFESVSGYRKRGFPKDAVVLYFGRPTAIEFSQDAGNNLEVGHALLTSVGSELAPICGAVQNQEFYVSVADRWIKQGLILTSLLEFGAMDDQQ
jgi:Protein of unknown function (DUF2806).